MSSISPEMTPRPTPSSPVAKPGDRDGQEGQKGTDRSFEGILEEIAGTAEAPASETPVLPVRAIRDASAKPGQATNVSPSPVTVAQEGGATALPLAAAPLRAAPSVVTQERAGAPVLAAAPKISLSGQADPAKGEAHGRPVPAAAGGFSFQSMSVAAAGTGAPSLSVPADGLIPLSAFTPAGGAGNSAKVPLAFSHEVGTAVPSPVEGEGSVTSSHASSTAAPPAQSVSPGPTEPSVLSPPSRAGIAQQLATPIADQIRVRADQIQVDLHPADLGRVTIRLKMKEGMTQLHIAVERPAALEALRQGSQSLQTALAEAGADPGQTELSFDLSGDHGRRPEGEARAEEQSAGDREARHTAADPGGAGSASHNTDPLTHGRRGLFL